MWSVYSLDHNAEDPIALYERVEHIQACGDVPEDGVVTIEMWLRRVCDEILAATGVGSRERHSDGASVVPTSVQLIANRVPGTAIAVAAWVAVLRHEVRDDSVKRESVVVASTRELNEVVHGQRRVGAEKNAGWCRVMC